jgi:Helicase conserved C-terminal domain/Type III restriction enzyme, res subunit
MTLASLVHECTLFTNDNSKVHKYQKKILDGFEQGKSNKYFLSASTSFGKTHLVFEIIKKMRYSNIVLIFPTIALLSENLEKVIADKGYDYFNSNYKIHTLSEVSDIGDKNLFIYTPERFLSFIEKNEDRVKFDFAFVDEVYKIDNDYLIDEELKENERDVAYRLAVFYALKSQADILLAGPYIDFSKPDNNRYNKSFDTFLSRNEVLLLDFNNYEIVNKSFNDIKTAKSYVIDDVLKFDFDTIDKEGRLNKIIENILAIKENSIIYCSSKNGTESYAKKLIKSQVLGTHDYSAYQDFLDHVGKNFSTEWVVFQALKNGIGIHHGLVPKYIQKEIIALFNAGRLKVLLSTTTITEGVNTSAKNLVVLHSKKGSKELKKFDAKNIAGRAGRFLYHYSGRVIVLQNNFMKAINAEPEGIKHKNYDLEAPKDEIDLFYSGDEFLSNADKVRTTNILQEQANRQMPDYLFNFYKVVSRIDKIRVYDEIKKRSPAELQSIRNLISILNYRMDIDYDGFEVILKVISPIVRNPKVKFFIEYKGKKGTNSTLTHLVHFYLQGGFIGSVDYRLKQGEEIDKAIKETADFIYNILKYQVVKYLGVFNIMYKFYLSQQGDTTFENAIGIDTLLTKLEYNALSNEGRIASDYGVPSSVLEYYENSQNAQSIKANFDTYENSIFQKIDPIIKKEAK